MGGGREAEERRRWLIKIMYEPEFEYVEEGGLVLVMMGWRLCV